jgi:hypothetical protein
VESARTGSRRCKHACHWRTAVWGVNQSGRALLRYTHKTSGFKTSGFKTSGFKTSETSGFQNVIFTKRQVYKMSGLQNVRSSKRPVAKKTSIYILYLWLVEIRRSYGCNTCKMKTRKANLLEEAHAFFAVVLFNSTSTPPLFIHSQNYHVIPSLLVLVFLLSV